MGIIIDAIVVTDLVKQVGENVKNSRVVISTDGKISSFVDAVLKQLKSSDGGTEKMAALRIWGHGITEYSDGRAFPSGNVMFGHDADDLRMQTWDEFLTVLQRLTGAFGSPARAELRGCCAARGENGKDLMKHLAALWRVEVRASEKTQWQIMSWGGNIVVASIDGTIREIPGPDTNEGLAEKK